MSSDFTPPGSSTYSSDTLFVGDGTWDTQRNTFLLPNLMGLNFETMRYNGELLIPVEFIHQAIDIYQVWEIDSEICQGIIP